MVVRQHKIKYCRHIVFHQLVGGGGERGRGEIIPANAQPRTQGLISAEIRPWVRGWQMPWLPSQRKEIKMGTVLSKQGLTYFRFFSNS